MGEVTLLDTAAQGCVCRRGLRSAPQPCSRELHRAALP